ncbi:serine protease inhibitor dipetalogastin-like [Homalodisca vitripennis]|uniref:serine protease inhibitor dipetalogastin-like n=1 Tax=Homalodisca vitripennis TaxID=197043 RepID=UPI001EEAFFA8|nr:serine protease inhibitor dipetalogastin-like [Homalodisca vitripennis]
MLLLLAVWVTVTVTAVVANLPTPSDLHEMELSTFYADCSVYEDPALFGGPVCCSDGQTYANCVHMACLNHWRAPEHKVKLMSKGPCEETTLPPTWSPVYLPVCGLDNLTYANIDALVLHNENSGSGIEVQYEGECMNPTGSCLGVDVGFWKDAVCASNGRTYPSVTAVADMRRFGQCLDVLHDGGCTVEEVRERMKTRAEICELARSFYEYNPVCGNDDISYANPYIMLCFRPNVEEKYMGECDCPEHKACQAAVDIDSGAMECPGPVCGSDGLTYTSIHHLDCAKINDKHLFLLHEGPCSPADNPCVSMPPVDDGGSPVCGSDGVTYVNSYAIWCMQRKEDPYLRFFHDGPCFRRCVECSCNLSCPAV